MPRRSHRKSVEPRPSFAAAGGDGVSLEQQEIAITAYAHGAAVDVHSIGQDIASAGDRPMTRPDMLELIRGIDELRRLEVQARVGNLAANIDQLARSLAVLDLLREKRVPVWVAGRGKIGRTELKQELLELSPIRGRNSAVARNSHASPRPSSTGSRHRQG